MNFRPFVARALFALLVLLGLSCSSFYIVLGHCNIKKGTNDYNGLNDFAICTDCGANFVARWEGAKATFKHWSSSRLLTSTFQRAEGKGGGVCDPRIVNELICKLVDEDEEEGGQSV